MKKGIKAKPTEKLDEASIARVISLLKSTPPITKKEACEILNISYNTTRLNSIIVEHEEKVARRKKLYDAKKGTPFEEAEISNIIKWYLQGTEVTEIAALLFRPTSAINRILENLGVPRRLRGRDNYIPTLLPEECIVTSVKPGDVVWSAFYDAAAEVIKYVGLSRDKIPVYQIYVFQPSEGRRKAGFYCYQRIEELGSLEHLKKYITIEQITS